MQIRIENNLCAIDNYKQIKSLKNDLIIIDNIKICGSDFKILKIDNEKIIINGSILNVSIGE